MKTRLLFITLLVSSCATMVTFSENEAVSHVFDDTPGSQDELYLKANSWMIETFNNAESVVQHNDKEQGVIIGKYLLHGSSASGLYGNVDNRIYATIDIRLKDNKARIEIKPQGSWQYDESGMSVFSYSKQDAIADMNHLAESLHQSLLKKAIEF